MGTKNDTPMNNNSSKKPSHSENLKKLMELLHKYLPNNFPEVTIISDEKNIFNAKSEDGMLIVKLDRNGKIISKFDPRFISEFSFGINVLMHFLRQYNGAVTTEFEIAGLPWTFNLRAFVKLYAPLLYKTQMKKILIAMNAKEGTYKKYLKDFRKSFKDAECDRFKKKFFKLVKDNNHQAVWDCDDIFLQKLGGTENQLLEWKKEKILGRKIMLDDSWSPMKLVYKDNEE